MHADTWNEIPKDIFTQFSFFHSTILSRFHKVLILGSFLVNISVPSGGPGIQRSVNETESNR